MDRKLHDGPSWDDIGYGCCNKLKFQVISDKKNISNLMNRSLDIKKLAPMERALKTVLTPVYECNYWGINRYSIAVQ